MKKLIILFALFSCLLPFSVYGAGICEVKCCDNSTGCEDLDPFCNNFAATDKIGYSELSSCSTDQITAAKCGASETATCCCFRDKNITTQVSTKVTSLNFTPEISIPGSVFNNTAPIKIGTPIETNNGNVKTVTMNSDLLAKYIQAIYNYGLAIVSILAAIVLMGGGLVWLTSGGDSSKVTKAKEMIIGSISGLVILFCAWIILNTVNPELLKLKPISTVVINKVVIGCCEQAKDDKTVKMTTPTNCTGAFYENRTLNNGKCEGEICCEYINSSFSQLSRCFRAFPGACSKFLGYNNGKIVENTCSNVTECQGTISMLSCDGIQDGEVVSKESLYNNLYCYNSLLYWGSGGLLSEPCGIKPGGYGVCVKLDAKCNDRNQLGGRWCELGRELKCCLD